MKFVSILTALGFLSAFAAAAPTTEGNAVNARQTKDGYYCEECVSGKRECIACTDGTCLGFTQNC